ncbi:hypothetical protein BDV12DRAFT_181258 [Aspergillus spectabilis]
MQSSKSASKIEDAQYLALKALWEIRGRTEFTPKDWGIHDVNTAQKMLNTLPGWQKYLSLVPEKATLEKILPIEGQDLGDFKLIWYYQKMIQQLDDNPEDTEKNVAITPITERFRPRSLSNPQNIKDESKAITKRLKAFTFETPGVLLTPRGGGSDSASIGSDESPSQRREQKFDPNNDSDDGSDSDSDEDSYDDLNYEPESEDREVFPAVSDENIVNTLVVAFASIITFSFKGVKGHWSQERRGYKVVRAANSTQAASNKKLYEARTDGHLFIPNKENTNSSVIIEVKPMERIQCPRVRMQETAQMVAWIHAEPDDLRGKSTQGQKFRRLLLSQNRHEIFLIFAEYDSEYLDYVTNSDRTTKCNSFLRMNEFGPWDILDAAHVQAIASIILAVTLQFSKGRGIHPTA